MRNHDGWVIKTKEGTFLLWSFLRTRTKVVQRVGKIYWRYLRTKRGAKIVKVKLMEVNDE